MSLEEELEKAIEWEKGEEPDSSVRNKSIFAYCKLRRFDQAKEWIHNLNGEQKFWFPDVYEFQVIVDAVEVYRAGEIDKREALARLTASRRKADEYLKSKGYDVSVFVRDFDRQSKENKRKKREWQERERQINEDLKKLGIPPLS